VEKNPTPGEIVVMAGAGLTLLFSFFPFYKLEVGDFSDDTSAWGSGLFPVATFIVLFAVAAGVLVALTTFANVHFPPTGFLGIARNPLLLVLTFFSALLAVGYLLLDKGGFDFGFGFWFVLIGSVATLVGAIVIMNEAKTRA
jgi:hypothetical protein